MRPAATGKRKTAADFTYFAYFTGSSGLAGQFFSRFFGRREPKVVGPNPREPRARDLGQQLGAESSVPSGGNRTTEPVPHGSVGIDAEKEKNRGQNVLGRNQPIDHFARHGVGPAINATLGNAGTR